MLLSAVSLPTATRRVRPCDFRGGVVRMFGTVAPGGAMRSVLWRRAREGRSRRSRCYRNNAALDGGRRTPHSVQRRRRLGRFDHWRRQMLAERAVWLVSTRAVLASCRLDVRIGARAHSVALGLRVRDGYESRQQELQQDRDLPQRSHEARRSAHEQTLSGGRH